MGGTGDEIQFAAVPAELVRLLCDQFRRPVWLIHFPVVDAAHECDIFAVFFDQSGQVIDGHTALPYVDTHLDHCGHQGRAIAVAVVDYQFYAVVMVIFIEPFIWIQEKLAEHLRADECGVLRPPVIVME